MSGPRKYHSHPNMAEPCVVPDEPRDPFWRQLAGGIAEFGVLLLVILAILAAIAVAGGTALH